ncbi:MAG: hydrogenase maturation protease [bacterium]
MSSPPLIIGCGNPDRGDDAAGILVARRLRERGIAALEHSRDGLDLMEAWLGAPRVILIDAVLTGAPAGTVLEWDGRAVNPAGSGAGTHGFGVAEAIGLARVLGRLPESLAIIGIEAASFAHGAALTPEVARSVEHVAERIILESERCTNPES